LVGVPASPVSGGRIHSAGTIYGVAMWAGDAPIRRKPRDHLTTADPAAG